MNQEGYFPDPMNVLHEESGRYSGLWKNLAKIWPKGFKIDLQSHNEFIWLFSGFPTLYCDKICYFCLCEYNAVTWKGPYYLRIKNPVSIHFPLD